MGTTWIFGFLAIREVKFAFQLIFCVLNAFQGFFLFLLFVTREAKVRHGWKQLCGCLDSKESPPNSSTQGKKTKKESFETSPVSDKEFFKISTASDEKVAGNGVEA